LILGYFCIIIIFQSIIGVGVLVLGTPFLLILKFNIVEIFFILLPISIITSLLNLLIINFSNKSLDKSTYKEFKKFFIICIPSIFVGLIILKLFNNYLNFKLLVALIIFFSITLVILKDKIKFRINFFRISILSIVGIIHGLTNSGGTLMSLALSVNNKKNYARLNTSFFYFVLATFQYLLTTIIFYDKFVFPNNYKLIIALIIGVCLGNLINHYLESKTYKIMVNSLAVISALILISV
ncbi:TSUP family transporter, partial [Candidatus Pelagibacter sp.]|nr:TSUP family transporter [Candidatus Pelagibacter sp.]